MITSQPDQKVFMVVDGELKDKDQNADGFDRNYDGLISLKKLKLISKSSNEDCK